MSLSQSRSAALTVVTLIYLTTSTYAATTCADSVHAALDTITSSLSGLNYPCCQISRANCVLSDDDCVGTFPDFASCISAAGSAACGITDTVSSGAPCAAYKGTAGPYGVSPVGSDGLNFDLDDIVTANWPRLGLDDSVVLCCSADNGPCHLGELVDDDINPCNSGEYELFCVGDAKQGMCTVRANTRRTKEIGQYFRINFDLASSSNSSATPAQSASKEPSTSSQGASLGSAIGPSPSSGSAATGTPSHNNALVIALPVVLGVLLLATCSIIFIRRRAVLALKPRELPMEERITPVSVYAPTGNSYFQAESNLPSAVEMNRPTRKGTDMFSRAHARRVSSQEFSSTYVGHGTSGPAPPSYSEFDR